MFIINRKKYFQQVYFKVTEKYIDALKNIENILMRNGAADYIDEDYITVTTLTFLFCLYFVEGALQHKYWPKYKTETSAIMDTIIQTMCKSMGLNYDKTRNAYFSVRTQISDVCFENERTEAYDPIYITAISFIIITFNNKYHPDELGYGIDTVETEIANVFRKLLNDCLK